MIRYFDKKSCATFKIRISRRDIEVSEGEFGTGTLFKAGVRCNRSPLQVALDRMGITLQFGGGRWLQVFRDGKHLGDFLRSRSYDNSLRHWMPYKEKPKTIILKDPYRPRVITS